MEEKNTSIGPALFFYVNGELLFHGCSLDEGEPYGNFINYPFGHFDIWNTNYHRKYRVDFDFYPRGRVVYRKTDDTYLIYYDKCIKQFIGLVTEKYIGKNIETRYDEHYQCRKCNKNYVI